MEDFEADILCKICQSSPRLYICPRCKVYYCSLSCYKVHSKNCVEEFQKEQVFEELRSSRVTIGEKKEFEKLLGLFKDFDCNSSYNEIQDHEDPSDLDDTRIDELVELCNNDKLSLDHLTEEECKKFLFDIQNQDFLSNFEIFNPWWNQIASQAPTEFALHICCKGTLKPNPSVCNIIYQAIYAYVHLMRSTHGYWEDDIESTAIHLMKLSKTLFYKTEPPETLETCLNSSLNKCNQLFFKKFESSFNKRCLIDLQRIFSFKDFILKALQEIYTMLLTYQDSIYYSKEHEKSDLLAIQFALKKLDYLASYTTYHWPEINATENQLNDYVNWLLPK